MRVVLVESPTKARKLGQFLGKEYIVEASMGHVRDLPSKTMGVDVNNNFEPTYEITTGRKKVIEKMKSEIKKADMVYLATDPDREGEAIAWHLQYLLDGKNSGKKGTKKASKQEGSKPTFVRSTFHEITKEAVQHALENPTEINSNLVDAQQARRVVDRLVGYYLSPVLWKKIRRGLSAGRVQSVALRLIVEREREIKAFVPQEYWEVDVLLSQTGKTFSKESLKDVGSDQVFRARLSAVDGTAFDPKKQEDVSPYLPLLPNSNYVVESLEKTQRSRSSYPPFTTSTLQQAASNTMGWSAKQTMMIAQQLYEEGFITYHRTDSVALASQALTAIRSHIQEKIGKEYLPESPNYFKKSSKNAQEAHEAIRPTHVSVQDPNEIASALSDKHAKLYQLIWNRTVASQMVDAVYDQTSVTIVATSQTNQTDSAQTGSASSKTETSKAGVDEKQHVFSLRASGSVMRFDGWMRLYPQKKSETSLPQLQEKETLQYQDTDAQQKFTQPPARYNDASLIKTLEKLGIGRPSTYASIISVILDRGYVERKEKTFIPSVIGETVADFLVKNFPKELDYQFTADMEDDLDAIARGEKQWKKVLQVFFTPFQKNVESVTKTGDRAKVPVEETGESCPECKEGKIVIRSGRFGKFYSCSRFPECRYTARIIEKVEGMVCPNCGKGDVVVKKTKRGRTFYGCSRYPSCNYASWNKPGTEKKG